MADRIIICYIPPFQFVKMHPLRVGAIGFIRKLYTCKRIFKNARGLEMGCAPDANNLRIKKAPLGVLAWLLLVDCEEYAGGKKNAGQKSGRHSLAYGDLNF